MRKEYDFSQGVRGAHAARYAEGVQMRVLHEDDSHNAGRPTPSQRDPQLVELAGKHLLIAQLLAGGVEVAEPISGRGFDLIVYRERPHGSGGLVACPMEVKAYTGRHLELETNENSANLLIAYVWMVGDPAQASIYGLTYTEAHALFESSGFTESGASEKMGRYSVPSPGRALIDKLENYRMEPGKWIELMERATSERARS